MASGEILYFDNERGTGFVGGDDGSRYVFARSDLGEGVRSAKGTRISFRPDGDRAREIVATGPQPWGAAPASTAEPGAASLPIPSEPGPGLGLFAYFRKCLAHYADFRGRARRKEYWGFTLFVVVCLVIVGLLGLAADGALGNLDRQSGPAVTLILMGLVWLAVLIPSLAVTVRRQHDIGISGWFILLVLIPSIGGLIILVFALIPTEKHPNKWGPVPAGLLR